MRENWLPALMLGLSAIDPGWAATDSAEAFVCRRGPDVRVVELVRERAGTNASCAVTYRKETENPGRSETLWRATGNTAYCRGKAESLVKRLAEWGWRCDGTEPPAAAPDPLTTAVDAYLSELRARYQTAFAGARIRIGRERLALGDLDGDGDDDAVVQLSIERAPAGVRASIAVFVAEDDGSYRHLATRSLGAGSFQWPTRVSIRAGRVVLTTAKFGKGDRGGGPVQRGRAVYEIVETRLVEVETD